MSTVRLQKLISNLGLASRRVAEEWITEGRLSIDGEIAKLGDQVKPTQQVTLDGETIPSSSPISPRILLMNKREGWEVSRRPGEKRKSVFAKLPTLKRGRWISVGRLDVNTSGLLLFTNIGDLAHALTHPSSNIDREYAVRVKAHLDEATITRLLDGVRVDGELLALTDIRHYDGSGTNHWYHVCLMTGRNREVRDLFRSQNILVSRLKRVRFGPFVLPNFVAAGQVVEVHVDEVNAVCEMLNLTYRAPTLRRTQSKSKKRSVLIPFPSLTLPEWAVKDLD